jgi:hypothetical protein
MEEAAQEGAQGQRRGGVKPEQEGRGHFRTFIARGKDSRVLRCLDCGLDLNGLNRTNRRTLSKSSGKP